MHVYITDEGQRGALVQAFTEDKPSAPGGVGGWKRGVGYWWTRVQGERARDLLHHPLVQMQGGGEDEPAAMDLDPDTGKIAGGAW